MNRGVIFKGQVIKKNTNGKNNEAIDAQVILSPWRGIIMKLKGFENIEFEKEKIMNIGSIARINQVINILEGLEPSKEITECIEILEEVKKIEGW